VYVNCGIIEGLTFTVFRYKPKDRPYPAKSITTKGYDKMQQVGEGRRERTERGDSGRESVFPAHHLSSKARAT